MSHFHCSPRPFILYHLLWSILSGNLESYASFLLSAFCCYKLRIPKVVFQLEQSKEFLVLAYVSL